MNPTASTLWLEVGAMQGGSRNQLELTDELATFFGPDARRDEIVLIHNASGLHFRPFVYRGDDYGHYTERWRLCLPTQHMGGPEYPNRVVRFDKVVMSEVPAFSVAVEEVGSPQHNSWRTASANNNGGTGTTSGGREFGWF